MSHNWCQLTPKSLKGLISFPFLILPPVLATTAQVFIEVFYVVSTVDYSKI